jgi:uncharacterized membrane protein
MRGAIEILPEETLRDVVDSLVRLVEAAGAAVIFIGALIGVVKFIAALPKRNPEEFVPVRLSLGRYLALGLEFQLASDVLRTAIAPSFQELGKLAAVAAIRTALNFFLAREIHEERQQVAEKQGTTTDRSTTDRSTTDRSTTDRSSAAGSSAGRSTSGSVYSRAVRAGARAGLLQRDGERVGARADRSDLADRDGAAADAGREPDDDPR